MGGPVMSHITTQTTWCSNPICIWVSKMAVKTSKDTHKLKQAPRAPCPAPCGLPGRPPRQPAGQSLGRHASRTRDRGLTLAACRAAPQRLAP